MQEPPDGAHLLPDARTTSWLSTQAPPSQAYSTLALRSGRSFSIPLHISGPCSSRPSLSCTEMQNWNSPCRQIFASPLWHQHLAATCLLVLYD